MELGKETKVYVVIIHRNISQLEKWGGGGGGDEVTPLAHHRQKTYVQSFKGNGKLKKR
jgi:hypothetical protein